MSQRDPSEAEPQMEIRVTWKRETSFESVPETWQIGDLILQEYEVTRLLGKGGMGVVYQVHDCLKHVDLAVKSPMPGMFSSEEDIENFVREAETWVHLEPHPNIVLCSYILTLGHIPRIFAEYVEGGSLAEWIQRHKLYKGGQTNALARILDVAIMMAWGIHAAHEQGLVHQDIKPTNVMMTGDGIAKVTDFGLSRARALAGKHTDKSGEHSIPVTSGGYSILYCSPEQYEGETLGRRTDIWSWAVSVLEMFVGGVTWRAGIMALEALDRYKPQGEIIPLMPPEIEQVLRHCFQPRPEDRPASMLQVAHELKAIYQRQLGRPYPRSEKIHRAIPRHHILTNRAHSLNELGKYEEALATYEEVIRLDPNGSRIYSNKGSVLFQLGRYEEALAAFEEYIRLDPESSEGYFNKGKTLIALDRPEEALAMFEQALCLDPYDARKYYHKGNMLMALKRYEEALVAFEQSIQLDPEPVDAYAQRGDILSEFGRYAEALAMYEQVLSRDPNRAEIYAKQGALLFTLDRLEEAIDALEQAIRLDPNLIEIYLMQSGALRRLDRLEEAVAVLEQVIRLDPKNADAYFHQGGMLVTLKRYEEALNAVEQYMRLQPDDAFAYVARGEVLLLLDRPGEALRAIKQAIHLHPNDSRAYGIKRKIERVLSAGKEALAAFEQESIPTPVDTLDRLQGALEEGKPHEEILAALEEAIRLDPHNASYHNDRGTHLFLLR
ncbi:MAG: tetratricopeptide repeat protein, partial [Ktedonobacteraceae bacterium]|nr:tetratricopeptide repeat protein [Ktedonobacteraceae bacterium]